MDLQITRKQREFIESPAFETLFGGAAGGGKSYGQLIDALLYALKHAGSKQLILRRTYPDLERSLVLEHLKFFPRPPVYKYSGTTHRGTFANGSTVEFGYLDTENDVFQYQGAEYDVVRFDELTHFTETMYTYLFSRVRGANNFPKAVKSSTNPGGVGHAWVKSRFIDSGPSGVIQQHDTGTRLFIPSFLQDNKFLMENDPDYGKRLNNLDESTRAALRDGEWDLFEGRYFNEFSRETHVIKPCKLADNVRRYVAIDYGMDMLAALWIAVDQFGHATVYKELYEGRDNKKGKNQQGHIISAAAKRLLEVNGKDKISAWLAPPDLWNRRQDSGKSAAELFYKSGVMLEKTSNNRITGWQCVREWLACKEDEFGDVTPNMEIFETCTNIIRTLPSLQHDSKNPEDATGTPHELTHAPDALRCFCVSRTAPARAIEESEKDFIHRNFSIKDKIKSPLGKGGKYTVI